MGQVNSFYVSSNYSRILEDFSKIAKREGLSKNELLSRTLEQVSSGFKPYPSAWDPKARS
jgi:hypothetical protein